MSHLETLRVHWYAWTATRARRPLDLWFQEVEAVLKNYEPSNRLEVERAHIGG
jgi:hypothetical protein